MEEKQKKWIYTVADILCLHSNAIGGETVTWFDLWYIQSFCSSVCERSTRTQMNLIYFTAFKKKERKWHTIALLWIDGCTAQARSTGSAEIYWIVYFFNVYSHTRAPQKHPHTFDAITFSFCRRGTLFSSFAFSNARRRDGHTIALIRRWWRLKWASKFILLWNL